MCPRTCAKLMAEFEADRADRLRGVDEGERDRVTLAAEAERKWTEAQQSVTELEAKTASLQVMVEQLEARKSEEERVELEQRRAQVEKAQDELLEQLGLTELSTRQLATLVLELGRHGVENKDDFVKMIRVQREAAAAEGDDEKEVTSSAVDEEMKEFRKRDDERKRETRRIERQIEERRKKKEQKEKEAQEAAEAARVAAEEAGTPIEDSTTTDEATAGVEEEEEEELVLPEVETHPVDVLFAKLSASEEFAREETASARQQYDETKKELTTEESNLKTARGVVEKAYGPDRILLAVKDECIESTSGKYVYKACFFGKATQDSTSLGTMKELKGEVESEKDTAELNDRYKLRFEHGTKCWNGPHRSLAVDVVCGPLPMELYDVQEPSTCVYSAKLRSPIACDAEHREALTKLDARMVSAVTPHHIEVEVPATL